VGRNQGSRQPGKAWGFLRACLHGPSRSALFTSADLEHGETEERWFSIGFASNGAILSIVYLWSESDPVTTKIRLISAREATKMEIRRYKESV
jgi:uncharacterized DUF497 family protein